MYISTITDHRRDCALAYVACDAKCKRDMTFPFFQVNRRCCVYCFVHLCSLDPRANCQDLQLSLMSIFRIRFHRTSLFDGDKNLPTFTLAVHRYYPKGPPSIFVPPHTQGTTSFALSRHGFVLERCTIYGGWGGTSQTVKACRTFVWRRNERGNAERKIEQKGELNV